MTRTLMAVLALSLLVAAPAEAGKKKKKKDQETSAPPTSSLPAEAEEAPADDGEMSIGRPAGMDFLELPCPYTAGTEHTWTFVNEQDNGKATGTQILRIVEVTPGSFTFDVGGEAHIETDDPVLQRITEAANGFDVEPRVQFFTEAMAMNVANLEALKPLYSALVDELEPTMKEADLPPAAIANIRRMMTDPGMIENSLTRNLYPLFNFTCGSFPTTPIDYETQMPSPMGPPLPAKGRITPERPGPDRVTFVNTEAVPVDALIPAIVAMSKGAMPEEEVRKAMEEIDGEVTTTLTVEVDVPTGAITSMVSEQVVKIPGAEKRSRRELTAVAE